MTSKNEYQNMNYPNSQSNTPPLAYAPQQPQQQYIPNGQQYIPNAQPVHYDQGYAQAETQSSSTALCLLISGLFLPIFHVVNVCMHIGSSVPKKKLYAKLSLGILIFEVILALVLSRSNM